MGRKSRQNLQEINGNVLVRVSQTFAWMQELRAKGHLTGLSRERYKVTSREYRNFYREQHISQTQDEISGMEK